MIEAALAHSLRAQAPARQRVEFKHRSRLYSHSTSRHSQPTHPCLLFSTNQTRRWSHFISHSQLGEPEAKEEKTRIIALRCIASKREHHLTTRLNTLFVHSFSSDSLHSRTSQLQVSARSFSFISNRLLETNHRRPAKLRREFERVHPISEDEEEGYISTIRRI